MDIYRFIRSRDVAAHCRAIGKTWNTCEMAAIIDRSDLPMAEKHAAWRVLITDYPDMPSIRNIHRISFDSTHKKLEEIIAYNERIWELFQTPENDMLYRFRVQCDDVHYDSDCLFSTYEKALASARDRWEQDGISAVRIFKQFVDDETCERGGIEAVFNDDETLRRVFFTGRAELNEKYCASVGAEDLYYGMFEDNFYIDIPTPFKQGDILAMYKEGLRWPLPVFVLDRLYRDNSEWLEACLRGDRGDGTDLCGWAYYVAQDGLLTANHAMNHDRFVYFKDHLDGKNRLLHYVSLFLKKEIGLPELLTWQCRIMMEHLLENNLQMD